jgi:hypothetical protein
MDQDRYHHEVTSRLHRIQIDPDALAREAEDIYADMDWADRAAAATDDNCAALGKLLEEVARHFRTLPESIQQAFRLVERNVDDDCTTKAAYRLQRGL